MANTENKITELKQKYCSLCHSMQNGVAFSKDKSDQTPKHLRVGINSNAVSNGALVRLLIEKKILTELEYWQFLVKQMQEEVDTYKSRLKSEYGTPVNLD